MKNAYLSEAPGGLLHVRTFYFTDCPLDKRNLISEPTQRLAVLCGYIDLAALQQL